MFYVFSCSVGNDWDRSSIDFVLLNNPRAPAVSSQVLSSHKSKHKMWRNDHFMSVCANEARKTDMKHYIDCNLDIYEVWCFEFSTKWPLLCRRHFQRPFFERALLFFYSNLLNCVPKRVFDKTNRHWFGHVQVHRPALLKSWIVLTLHWIPYIYIYIYQQFFLSYFSMVVEANWLLRLHESLRHTSSQYHMNNTCNMIDYKPWEVDTAHH